MQVRQQTAQAWSAHPVQRAIEAKLPRTCRKCRGVRRDNQ
jgi:hypothetical protein